MGWALLSNRLPAEQTDEGRDAGSFLSVAAACPDAHEFHTQKPAGRKKPSPGGWCSAQRIQNLYDCQWQSYLYYGGPAQAGPDEVEGHSVVPTYGENRQLRPHPSALKGCQLLLQEKPSLRSTGPVPLREGSPYTGEAYDTLFLRMKFERIGACRRPYVQNRTACRPSSGPLHAGRLLPRRGT